MKFNLKQNKRDNKPTWIGRSSNGRKHDPPVGKLSFNEDPIPQSGSILEDSMTLELIRNSTETNTHLLRKPNRKNHGKRIRTTEASRRMPKQQTFKDVIVNADTPPLLKLSNALWIANSIIEF